MSAKWTVVPIDDMGAEGLALCFGDESVGDFLRPRGWLFANAGSRQVRTVATALGYQHGDEMIEAIDRACGAHAAHAYADMASARLVLHAMAAKLNEAGVTL